MDTSKEEQKFILTDLDTKFSWGELADVEDGVEDGIVLAGFRLDRVHNDILRPPTVGAHEVAVCAHEILSAQSQAKVAVVPQAGTGQLKIVPPVTENHWNH